MKSSTTITRISDRTTSGGAEEASWIYEVCIPFFLFFVFSPIRPLVSFPRPANITTSSQVSTSVVQAPRRLTTSGSRVLPLSRGHIQICLGSLRFSLVEQKYWAHMGRFTDQEVRVFWKIVMVSCLSTVSPLVLGSLSPFYLFVPPFRSNWPLGN
jgi:hypothetical protein